MWKHSCFSLTRICLRSCFFFYHGKSPSTHHLEHVFYYFSHETMAAILWREEFFLDFVSWGTAVLGRTLLRRTSQKNSSDTTWTWFFFDGLVMVMCKTLMFIWLIWRHWSHTKQTNLRYLEEQQFLYILICWYSQAMLLDRPGDFGCIEILRLRWFGSLF